ncbi:MAG: hypothetical protein HOM96_02355 [Rickettsiales bacterium]|jgi:type IV secretion/conjugal transfer VirB4 family ATPase|nr:hypothetical protein [Rickettsiales bacterium]
MLANIKKHQEYLLKTAKSRNEEYRLAEMIPLLDIKEDDKTVSTKEGGLFQVLKIEGIDFSGVSHEIEESLSELRKKLFDSLPANILLTFYYHRKKAITQNNKKLKADNYYAQQIINKWEDNFKDVFKTEIYLVIYYKYENVFKKNLFGKNTLSIATKKLDHHINELKNHVVEISNRLDQYFPSVLKHSNSGRSKLLNFLSLIVNGKEIELGNEMSDLSSILSVSDIEFNTQKKLIKINGDKTIYSKVISLKTYPDNTHAKLLEGLLSQRRNFLVFQSVIPSNRESLKMRIGQKQNWLKSFPAISFIASRHQDLQEAGEYIESGDVSFHGHSFSIQIFEESEPEVNKSRHDIINALNIMGVSSVVEGAGIELAHWSKLPDYQKLNAARLVEGSSANISDFITLGSSFEGLKSCAFGEEPICYFRTSQNTNYGFAFHANSAQDALSHTLVIGGSGKGKTTLISFLLANCLKYPNLKMLCFDSFSGINIPTNVFSGRGSYIDVGEDSELQLNPMSLPDKYSNRQFLTQFLKLLAGGTEQIEDGIITDIIKQNYSLPENQRILYNLRLAFGNESEERNGPSLALRLKKWLPNQEDHLKSDQANGMLFNSIKDSLTFEKDIIAFDMAKVLKDPELLAPLTSYIFHAFQEYINENPCPHIIFFDEMVQYFQNDTFSKFILKSIRESRKRRGTFIGAVQEASALTQNQNGLDALKSVGSYILFPEVTASAEDYIDELGLNEKEFAWVKEPNAGREIMFKRRGGDSVILNCDLGCLGEQLNLFSSKQIDVVKAKMFMHKNPDNWVEQFLTFKGV